jgi:hypothetical protein
MRGTVDTAARWFEPIPSEPRDVAQSSLARKLLDDALERFLIAGIEIAQGLVRLDRRSGSIHPCRDRMSRQLLQGRSNGISPGIADIKIIIKAHGIQT